MIATITKVIIVQMMNNEFICKFIMLVYSFCVIQIFEYMQLSICSCVFILHISSQTSLEYQYFSQYLLLPHAC